MCVVRSQLRHVTVDEVDFRPPTSFKIPQHRWLEVAINAEDLINPAVVGFPSGAAFFPAGRHRIDDHSFRLGSRAESYGEGFIIRSSENLCSTRQDHILTHCSSRNSSDGGHRTIEQQL